MHSDRLYLFVQVLADSSGRRRETFIETWLKSVIFDGEMFCSEPEILRYDRLQKIVSSFPQFPSRCKSYHTAYHIPSIYQSVYGCSVIRKASYLQNSSRNYTLYSSAIRSCSSVKASWQLAAPILLM
ncbi:uncharacterized protein ACN427_009346 [Glossina fuscipes fuscipes]